VSFLGTTTPANGDENPYAIWPVTQTIGSMTVGDVLVTNFNNKSNKQGTARPSSDVHPRPDHHRLRGPLELEDAMPGRDRADHGQWLRSRRVG